MVPNLRTDRQTHASSEEGKPCRHCCGASQHFTRSRTNRREPSLRREQNKAGATELRARHADAGTARNRSPPRSSTRAGPPRPRATLRPSARCVTGTPGASQASPPSALRGPGPIFPSSARPPWAVTSEAAAPAHTTSSNVLPTGSDVL